MGRVDATAEELLVAGFLSMQPAATLISFAREVGGGVISDSAQQIVLNKCLGNEVHLRYPSSKAYVRNVLKTVILTAEQEGQEVLESMYETYAVFSQAEQQLAERCYKTITYMIPDETISNLARTLGHERMVKALERKVVTLRVSLNMLDGDTGYFIWPAGLLLTEFLLSYPELVKGYSCLELGSGTGICGVWLARLCCSKLVLTDGSLSALANLRHNLTINGFRQPSDEDLSPNDGQFQVECRQLLWETATEEELASFNAEVIIGADLIYDPAPLVPVLAGLLRPKSKPSQEANGIQRSENQIGHASDGKEVIHPVAYMAQAIRNLNTLESYLSMVSQAGLQLVDITESISFQKCLPELLGFDRGQVRIHKVFYP
ncbi:hypothetical protein R1flu_018746 [Riccia fluitans]|uniref:FAM86 N-terminal domain-containing protein n=1 Tax=Riccia fluitans TaxID=41844 RepID=A0ABD1ZGQ5_9MARC